MTDKTVLQVFEEERPHLVPYAGRFDGFTYHCDIVETGNDSWRLKTRHEPN